MKNKSSSRIRPVAATLTKHRTSLRCVTAKTVFWANCASAADPAQRLPLAKVVGYSIRRENNYVEGQMRSVVLTAAVVVLAVGPIGGAGRAAAMVQKAPLASGNMTVLVQDQQELKQQQLKQQQLQRQELMEREKAARAEMRRAMIKHEEAKIIGRVKKYLHTEYESYGNPGGGRP
jgi:hypothetical protein